MADKITTYKPETAREILRRLDALELRQRSLLGGGYNQSFPQGPLVTRWAKTSTTPTYPTYPSSGNVVGVKFGEYLPSPLYPGATATKTFTAYSPEWYEFAILEDGSIPAVGTVVRCTWRDGYWWIGQSSSVRKRASMIANGTCNGWRDGAGAYAAIGTGTSLIFGDNGTDNKDVKLWPALSGCSTNDEGSAFEWVINPSAYSDNWLTLKQTGYVRICCSVTIRMNAADATDRDAYLLQAAHNHTNPEGGNTGSTTAQGLGLETLHGGGTLLITTSDGTSSSGNCTFMPVQYSSYGTGTLGICYAVAVCYRGATDEYINVSLSNATFLGGQLYMKPIRLTVTVEQAGDSGQF